MRALQRSALKDYFEGISARYAPNTVAGHYILLHAILEEAVFDGVERSTAVASKMIQGGQGG